MPRLPQHIQEHLDRSPHGPYNELEIARLLRLRERPLIPRTPEHEAEHFEHMLLAHRLVRNPTPTNVAAHRCFLDMRALAKGDSVG